MASNLKYSTTLKNGRLDQITSTTGSSAILRIYDGTQPTNPGTAISTQNALVAFTCNATAFAGASSGGTLTVNPFPAVSASVSGTASWFRLFTSGNTAVIDGSVGTSSSDLILDNTSINAGQTVNVTSFVFTAGN